MIQEALSQSKVSVMDLVKKNSHTHTQRAKEEQDGEHTAPKTSKVGVKPTVYQEDKINALPTAPRRVHRFGQQQQQRV